MPEDGSQGIPAAGLNNFLILIPEHPSNQLYELVVTDNALCSHGCVGDTRNYTSFHGTFVAENLKNNKWYYYIFRTWSNDSFPNPWSTIYSFYTDYQDVKNSIIVTTEQDFLRLKINWVKVGSKDLEIRIKNIQAQVVINQLIKRTDFENQFEEILIPISLPKTLLFMECLSNGRIIAFQKCIL